MKGRRLLVVTPYILRDDVAAGDRRFLNMLKTLREGLAMDYVALNRLPEDVGRYERALKGEGLRLLGYGHRRAQRALLGRSYDAVLFEFWFAESALSGFLSKVQPRCTTIIDSVDVHFAREVRAAALGAMPTANALTNREQELAAYRRSALVLAASEPDRSLLLSEGIEQVVVVPIMSTVRPRARRPRAPNAVFVGAYSHLPNPDGIRWFLRECWGAVRAAVPDATLSVVGKNPPADLLAHSGRDGIRVLGHVPDLDPVLDEAVVSIAPLRFGGGMKGKVADALACGLPVVTTSVGAQGLGDEHAGDAYLLADDPAGFADAVVRVMKDAALADRLTARGQELARRACSDAAAESGLSVLRTILDRGGSAGAFARIRGAAGWGAQRVRSRVGGTAYTSSSSTTSSSSGPASPRG